MTFHIPPSSLPPVTFKQSVAASKAALGLESLGVQIQRSSLECGNRAQLPPALGAPWVPPEGTWEGGHCHRRGREGLRPLQFKVLSQVVPELTGKLLLREGPHHSIFKCVQRYILENIVITLQSICCNNLNPLFQNLTPGTFSLPKQKDVLFLQTY